MTTTKKLTAKQIDALRQLVARPNDTTGIRWSTLAVLTGLGLVEQEWGTTSETFRPSRGWSRTRWTRTVPCRHHVQATEAGKALVAALAVAS